MAKVLKKGVEQMKLTVNTDPGKSPNDNPGVEVGLDSIQAWISMKQIDPVWMTVSGDSFGIKLTDDTKLTFVWDKNEGRVTVTPPGKRK